MKAIAQRVLDRIFTQTWFLAVRERSWQESAFLCLEGYVPLAQPRDEFRADPFLFEHEGATWVFFEQYPFCVGKGHIAVGRLDRDAAGSITLEEVQPALVRKYHLSYPCVFHADGQIWMLPETTANRTVELYRCKHFPDGWELDRLLLENIDAADATLFQSGGLWWLFTCELASSAAMRFRYKLCLYYGTTLQGPWIPHSLNPIRCSARLTRPAGKLFRDEPGEALLWPSQDCTRRYGGAVQFSRLTRLSPEEFCDVPAGSLKPDAEQGWKGLHTYQRSGQFEIIDALKVSFEPGLKMQGALAKTRRWLSR